MLPKFSKSESGFSMIEVILGFGLLSILTYASMTLISNQNKEMRTLDEKLSIQSTQILLTSIMSQGDYCKCFFGGNTFNTSLKMWNDFSNTIPNAYEGSGCNPMGTLLPTTSLKPVSVKIPSDTVHMIAPLQYSGQIQIQLDQNFLMRSRKPISIPVFFSLKSTGLPSAKEIESCSASNSQVSSAPPTSFDLFVPGCGGCSSSGVGPTQTRLIPAAPYLFCFLSRSSSGGDNGGNGDFCEVSRVGPNWILSGNRGSDPGKTCRALCIPK